MAQELTGTRIHIRAASHRSASLHNGNVQLWNYQMGTLVGRLDEHDGELSEFDRGVRCRMGVVCRCRAPGPGQSQDQADRSPLRLCLQEGATSARNGGREGSEKAARCSPDHGSSRTGIGDRPRSAVARMCRLGWVASCPLARHRGLTRARRGACRTRTAHARRPLPATEQGRSFSSLRPRHCFRLCVSLTC